MASINAKNILKKQMMFSVPTKQFFMRHLILLSTFIIIGNVSCAQTSLQVAQGIWKEDVEGFESYIVAEGNNWYSIVKIDGEVDISKEFFGFFDDFEVDSLNVLALDSDGQYLVFLSNRESIKDYRVDLPRKYFNFYSYDLDDDYFIYYANQPISLTKIDSLPEDIQEVFEKRKKELAHIKFGRE